MTRLSPLRPTLHTLAASLLGLGLLAAAPAHADSHALILSINYQGSGIKPLPGIDLDGQNASKMAQTLGVPAGNITWVKNRDLTLDGMRQAMRAFESRIRPGDQVFFYYSGHGTQYPSEDGRTNKCTEALVSHDGRFLPDSELQAYLARLTQTAARVVALNDSCYAGGAATKSVSTPGGIAKFVQINPAPLSNAASYQCNHSVNDPDPRYRSPSKSAGGQLVYLAASADNEVSFADTQGRGSYATLGWAQCLQSNPHSSAGELATCAQNYVQRNSQWPQSITLFGSSGAALELRSSNPLPLPATGLLHQLAADSDPAWRVQLTTSAPQLKIGRDYINLQLNLPRSGYVYLLYQDAGGQLNLLFPNDRDGNNYLGAGSLSLPRGRWGLQASGPAGSGALLALLTPQPLDLRKQYGMRPLGPYASTPMQAIAQSKLASGYGTSAVLTVQELP